jgi:anti-sigma regulatory factor (Ser/Thr protein kinase)
VTATRTIGASRAWTLEISADLFALRRVRRFAERIAHALDLDPTAAYQLKIALNEAASNAVVHGCRRSSDRVRMRAVADAEELAVEVVDPGGRFRRGAPAADPLGPGGRGTILLEATTDRVGVELAPGRTTVRFVKRLRSGPSAVA